MRPNYKLFNRLLPAVVLLSGIIYMPILRGNLKNSLDGEYEFPGFFASETSIDLLNSFDRFRSISIIMVCVFLMLLFFLRRKSHRTFLIGVAACAIIYIAYTAVFSFGTINKIFDLPAFILEQSLCSASLFSLLFIFPQKQ